MPILPRAALLSSWGSAAIAGRCGLDQAADAVAAGVDAEHTVTGLDDGEPLALTLALARLRERGATGLRLVLPRAGDPSGLPGPRAFNEAAVASGQAVLAVGVPLGLLPVGRGSWHAYGVAAGPPTHHLSVAEAARALNDAIRGAAADLAAMDVARWTPDAAELVDGRTAGPDLPPSWPSTARALLQQALRMAAVVRTALGSEGAAISSTEVRDRRDALLRLDDAARRAIEAACSAVPGVAEPSRG